MGCNVEAFKKSYFKEVSLPSPLSQGWAVTAIADDTVRPAIDLVIEDERGRRILVYVERKIEGAKAFVSTRFLNVSYYKVDKDIEEQLVGDIVKGIGALLRTKELVVNEQQIDAVFSAVADGGVPIGSTVELRINRDCNEECLFCNTPPESFSILAGKAQVLTEIEKQYSLGYRSVTFTGRETTLDPNLELYIRTAKERGYREVRIQTNGTALSSSTYLAKLVAAGLDFVQISLHTFRRDTFEKLIGKPALLDKAVQGLRNVLDIRSLGCEVLFVITTLNVGELVEFVGRLATDFKSPRLELVLSPVAPVGWGEDRLDLIPRLADLTPAMEGALEIAAKHSIKTSIPHRCGLPLCATPPRFYASNMDFRATRERVVEAAKAKSPKCVECMFDKRCVGVWRRYLEVHGDGDLVPVLAPAG